MANLSDIDICNQALADLGNKPIQNFNEDSKAARECKRFYVSTRDEMLERDDWSFAIKRATLTQLPDTPLYGWDYAYAMPSDYLRIVNVKDNPLYQMEGNTMLTNETAVYVRYVRIVTDPTQFHQLFRKGFRYELGGNMALALTGKKNLVVTLTELAENAREDALLRDAIEVPENQDGVPDNPWVTAGRTGSGTDPFE